MLYLSKAIMPGLRISLGYHEGLHSKTLPHTVHLVDVVMLENRNNEDRPELILQ